MNWGIGDCIKPLEGKLWLQQLILVSSHFVNSHFVNIDQMGIDKVGIDEVGS